MPQAVPAIVAGIGAGLAEGATIASVSFATVSTFALTVLADRMQPPTPQPMNSGLNQGATRQFRQALTERRLAYGEVRMSGALIPIASTSSNRYLHFIITLTSSEVESIDEIIVNEESIPDDYLDGGGNVIEGRYANYMRIKKHLGSDDQVADADLVNEVVEWDSDYRLRGISYIYVRLDFNRDLYPDGVPNFSAWVKGKKVKDTRDFIGVTEIVTDSGEPIVTDSGEPIVTGDDSDAVSSVYSSNAALQCVDYMLDSRYGLGMPYSKIDDDLADAAANLCDEMVNTKEVNVIVNDIDVSNNTITLTNDDGVLVLYRGDLVRITGGSVGGLLSDVDYYVIPVQRQGVVRIKLSTTFEGSFTETNIVDITGVNSGGVLTKYQEPRYHGGGVIDTGTEYGENLQTILSGMGGYLNESGGKWSISGLEFKTPDLYLDENDLHGSITVQPTVGVRDGFNSVQGVFVSQVNRGNPSDYPEVKNDTYITEDGSKKVRNLPIPFGNRTNTVQRIAKIYLERERQELRFVGDFSIVGLKLRPGDNFYFSFSRYGWENKIFEVLEMSLDINDGAPIVKMTCRENAAEVYSFTSSDEELGYDPSPNTSLPNPFNVSVVTGFALSSIPVSTQDGDKTYKINASWDEHPDRFVLENGRIEIAYKLSSESSYKFYPPVDGSSTEAELFQAAPDTLYDVRIRAINNIGAVSNYVEILGFRTGSSGGITSTEDWEYDTLTAEDWEYDTLTAEDWEA